MADELENNLRKFYEEHILTAGVTASGKEEEIVDIISDYPWTSHTLSSKQNSSESITFNHNIPFCYAIERRQTIASNVTSMINLLLGGSSALATATKRGAQSVAQNLENIAKDAQQKAAAAMQEAKQKAQAASGTTAANGNTSTTPQTATGAPAPQTNTPPANGQTAQGNNTATPVGGNNATNTGNNTAGNNSTPAAGGAAVNAAEAPESSVKQQGASTAQSLSNFLSKTANFISVVQDWLDKSLGDAAKVQLSEGNLQSSQFLQPWKWLYFTKITKKRYVFPTFSSNDLFNTSSSWGASSSKENPLQELIENIQKGAEIAYGLSQMAELLPGTTGQSNRFEMFNVETAKGYNYSADQTPEIDANFVLFNTTKKDAWKKNYRFLIMFILRNLPLRTSLYAFMPPLLYDVLIPGVKQLPLCYVASIGIKAEGHIRVMKCDNILKELVSEAKSDQTLVPVPEAWDVSIKFKCLIPDTMNLILSTVDFPITVSQQS